MDADQYLDLFSAGHEHADLPHGADVTMAESPSRHDDSSTCDQAASSPSDAGPDHASEVIAAGSDAGEKKRKKSATEGDKAAKPVKKRAPQACQECRSRKVRCDYKEKDGYVTNYPCGNCRHSMVPCIIPPSKRKRRQTHSLASKPSILPNPSSAASSENIRAAGDEPHHLPRGSVSGTDGQGAQAARPGKTYNGALERAQSPWGPTEEAVAWLPLIPPFIKLPVPGKITRDSLQHLVHMGALELPPVALEKQLLVAYAEHVHADFPILDLHDFIRRISHRDGRNGQLSLLLYQSVMFAASAFVDFAHVVAAGFKTRRAFRRSIFQAVKLLFDCDYESDKLVLAQSSLLLSFWYDAPDDSKETWYWAGIAISQAEALGLHRTALTANLDPAKRRLRKRIWWSLVIRDRQIGLGMSRLLRIKDNDFDVPMLQENDFEIAVMDDNTVLSHEDCPMLYDVGMQQELAEMCVEKTKLYVLIGRVLKGVQAFQDVANTRANPGADIIVEGLYSLDRIHRELAAWAAALPPTCQYRKLEQWDILHGRTPVAMQRTLLQMIYQTTVGKIYHPLMRSLRIQESHAEQQISQIARYKCKSVATEITRAIAEMHELQLDKYFPTTGVTVVMPAILVHLQDITSPVQETREEAQRGFDICMSVLNVLRETYAAAEIAAIFMGNLIKKKPGVESPAPLATDMLSNASSILPASGHAPRQAAALSQTFANGFMAMMQPRHGSGLSLHPDMSAMDLTTLPIIAPTALAGGIQGVRIPNSGQPPALAAKSSSTASASAATQQATVTESWSMDMTAHEQSSDESITMSPSNSSLESSSLRDKDQSGDAYGLVSQSISAEGLSFPRLDDGWQNWLNLPPEFDTNDNSGGSWANFADHIDPGALDAQAREIFS